MRTHDPRWGGLVAAALASALPAGCQPPAVAQAPLTQAPPAASSRVTPPAQEQLSPFAPLLPGTLLGGEQGDKSATASSSVVRIPFGRGHLSIRSFHSSMSLPSCPVIRDQGCSSFSVTTTGKSPGEEAWLSWTENLSGLATTTSKEVPSPRDWLGFSGGREVIYALRTGGIDRIDDQGKVSTFVEDKRISDWRELWVIEVGERVYVAAEVEGRDLRGAPAFGWSFTEALPSEKGGPRRLGELESLLFSPVGSNARSARRVRDWGSLARLGAPRIFRLPDEGEQKDRWAVAWLEAVPPPFDWPSGKPYRSPPAPLSGKKGGKNDCGGRGSRDLDDPSVEKRAHVTTLSGRKVIEDKIVWTSNDASRSFSIDARVDPGGVVRVERASAPSNRYRSRALTGEDGAKVQLIPAEQGLASAFDQKTGEGVAVIRSGERVFSRRFSAGGAPLQEVAELKEPPESGLSSLARAGKDWFGISPGKEPSMYNLTSPGKPLALSPKGRVLSLFSEGGALRLLSREGRKLWVTPLTEGGAAAGEPEVVGALPETRTEPALSVLAGGASPPRVFFSVEQGNEALVSEVWWATLKPGASWSKVKIPPEGSFDRVTARDTPRGHVLLLDRLSRPGMTDLQVRSDDGKWLIFGVDEQKFTAVDARQYDRKRFGQSEDGPWLRAAFDATADAAEEDDPPAIPLLLGTSGLPVHEPALGFVQNRCSHVLVAGPSSLALLCAEPIDAERPGVRVGIRIFRTHM